MSQYAIKEKRLVQFFGVRTSRMDEMAADPSVNMVAACAERTGPNLQQIKL